MRVADSATWLASSGRSSPNRPQFAPRPRCERTWRWWSGPQTCVPARLGRAALIGPKVGARPHLAPRTKPRRLVGLVELERLDRAAELALPALEVLVEQPADVRERDASSAAGRRGPTSWPARRDGPATPDSSSSRGVPIAFAARTTTRAGSKCSQALAVEPGRAGDEAGRVRLQAAHAGAGDEPRAGGDRLRPVGQVGRRLGALAAALLAGAALDARTPPVVGRPTGSSWAPATSASPAGRGPGRP